MNYYDAWHVGLVHQVNDALVSNQVSLLVHVLQSISACNLIIQCVMPMSNKTSSLQVSQAMLSVHIFKCMGQ